MLQSVVHYGIHFLVPVWLAYVFFKPKWKYAAIIMLACIAIDLDHVMANPVFDPTRCSLNFHPLHSYEAIAIYAALSVWKPSRILGIGLLIHILADAVDCLMMQL